MSRRAVVRRFLGCSSVCLLSPFAGVSDAPRTGMLSLRGGVMSELIDRYVAAATGRLSSSEREEKADELRGTIAGMLAARGSTDEQAEREVLAELGDPSELFARYAGRPRYLVGPALYGPYIKLLRTLVAIVASVVFAATLFAEVLAATDGAGWGILRALGAAIQTGVAIAFVVTLVFALLERAGKGAAEIGLPEKQWSPESLPEAGGKRQITLGEFIASLVFLTVLVALVKNTYTQSLGTDEFYSTVSPHVVGTPQTLGTKTVSLGVFDAADATWLTVLAGDTFEGVVIYKDTGVEATSPLLAYIDTITGFPLASNGGDITVQWDNGTYKIFSL